MNQQKYKKLEEIIREACPETMELKFGTKISISSSGEGNYKKYQAIVNCFYKEGDNGFTAEDIDTGGKWTLDVERLGVDIEILGSPLQLHHLLRAIQQNDNDYPIHIDFYFYRDYKLTITQAKGHPIINKEGNYDLTLSLKENCKNEDFANFLYEIFNIE